MVIPYKVLPYFVIYIYWPDKNLGAEFLPYSSRKSELSVLNGCIFRGSRIIIPPPDRQSLLEELHDTHPGITKMKALARSSRHGHRN